MKAKRRSTPPGYLDPHHGRLHERVALPLDTDTLTRIRVLAQSENRKYLDQIRYLLRLILPMEEQRLGITRRRTT